MNRILRPAVTHRLRPLAGEPRTYGDCPPRQHKHAKIQFGSNSGRVPRLTEQRTDGWDTVRGGGSSSLSSQGWVGSERKRWRRRKRRGLMCVRVFFCFFLELLIAPFKGIVGKADGWELFARFPASPSPLLHDQTADITFPRGGGGGLDNKKSYLSRDWLLICCVALQTPGLRIFSLGLS